MPSKNNINVIVKKNIDDSKNGGEFKGAVYYELFTSGNILRPDPSRDPDVAADLG